MKIIKVIISKKIEGIIIQINLLFLGDCIGNVCLLKYIYKLYLVYYFDILKCNMNYMFKFIRNILWNVIMCFDCFNIQYNLLLYFVFIKKD